jgi:hypothetical protein
VTDLGDFLAEGGAIVGGATAMGAALGFVLGALVHEARPSTDPEFWARRGGLLGGVAGLVVLIEQR